MKSPFFKRTMLAFAGITAILAAGYFAGCTQEPTAAPTTPGMNASDATTSAHPALTYASTLSKDGTQYWALYVMDTDATHQTAILTAGSDYSHINFTSPSWSPTGGSICWRKGGVSPDTIKAIDVSVNSKGVAVGSNVRTIYGLPDKTWGVGTVAWSSTSTMGKVAFTEADPTGTHYGLWTVPANGGPPTNIYSVDTSWLHRRVGLNFPTWSPDDSRLAVARGDSAQVTTIMIFNTTTWAYVDSIKVQAPAGKSAGSLGIEWSRTGLNKLAFSMNSQLYYCDPSTGAIPATDGVATRAVTWSPNNSSILIAPPDMSGQYKVVPFTTSTTKISSLNVYAKWKR